MNYERLRRNIECSLLSIISEATGSVLNIQQSKDSSGEIIKLVKAENADIIEECAKIAELYEPDEKLDYVAYASREIRRRMKC